MKVIERLASRVLVRIRVKYAEESSDSERWTQIVEILNLARSRRDMGILPLSDDPSHELARRLNKFLDNHAKESGET